MKTLELELAPDANLDATPRADLPVIWDGFRAQLTTLKATADTISVTDETQTGQMKLARTTRLALKNLRVSVENKRKELGEEALRRKQGIDKVATEIKALIEPLELRLKEAEEFAERAAEKRIADRFSARVAELEPLGFSSLLYPAVREMSEEEYAATLADAQRAKAARDEECKRAEEARLAALKAAEEERERQRVEAERIRAEAAENARLLAIERAKVRAAEEERQRVEAERRAEIAEQERKARAEADARETAARAAAEDERRKAAAVLAAERAAREEQERKAKEAHARLSDAAADLLAALRDLLEAVELCTPDAPRPVTGSVIAQARAAIAKAEGQP